MSSRSALRQFSRSVAAPLARSWAESAVQPSRGYAAGANPIWRVADIEGWGEKATTTLTKEPFAIVVDEPVALGGKDSAPNPLAFLMASLLGCSQYTLHAVCQQKKWGVGRVEWKGQGKFDLRGVRGDPGTSPAFQSIHVEARLHTELSQAELHELRDLVEQRCIVAATLAKAVPDFKVEFTKA